MNPLYKPEDGETIAKCVVPTEHPWELPLCTECGQVAYRIVTVSAGEGTERTIPLCGRHFIQACLQFPELEKFSRRGKMG
jgi:hypothetical protein